MSGKLRYTLVNGIKCYNPEEIKRYKDYPDDGFDLADKVEKENFWVCSRNRLLKNIINKYSLKFNKTKLLDIGCGTGAFIKEIKDNDNLIITGSDIYLKGLIYAKKKLPDVKFIQFDATKGRLNKKFDIVTAFDVIEHIDDDIAFISNIYRMTNSGGYFIVTVPQYMFLWSSLDEIIKHKRRYSKKELLSKLQQQKFIISYCSSFLFILFPLMLFSRIFDRYKKIENIFNLPKAVNWIFDKLMQIDEFLIGKGVSLPFGGSLLVIAKKNYKS